MSGHNKWSSIKHKKGAADAKRGRLFTRIVKEIIIAARDGGGDPASNPRLRVAINQAKANNMPNQNMERAIKRGTGELEGVNYEEFTYEGVGQNGVSIIVEVLTDNKNRAVAEVRHAFSKNGGKMASDGAVSWNFDTKGLIVVPANGKDEDEIMMEMLEYGADDVVIEDDMCQIYTPMADLHTVMAEVEKAGHEIKQSELTRIPKTTTNADDVAEKLLKLLDALEDLDDTQKVYSNYEISDEVMEGLV